MSDKERFLSESGTEEKLYFAYSNNINFDSMLYCCPTAQAVGTAVLEDYELLFRSTTGSNGIAAIAPRKGGKVHGLLWRISPEDERKLDIDRTHRHLYEKLQVTVRDRDGREFAAMTYEKANMWLMPAVPSINYYNSILEGYRQHGMPTASLKRAWEHSIKEVHGMAVRISDPHRQRSTPKKRRKGHER